MSNVVNPAPAYGRMAAAAAAGSKGRPSRSWSAICQSPVSTRAIEKPGARSIRSTLLIARAPRSTCRSTCWSPSACRRRRVRARRVRGRGRGVSTRSAGHGVRVRVPVEEGSGSREPTLSALAAQAARAEQGHPTRTDQPQPVRRRRITSQSPAARRRVACGLVLTRKRLPCALRSAVRVTWSRFGAGGREGR